MPLNLAILIILFFENDKMTPGGFKASLYHHAEFKKHNSNTARLYHRVLTRTQCEWILYESCHKFFMKPSRILYQTVTDSLQCWCARLKRSGNGNYGHI